MKMPKKEEKMLKRLRNIRKHRAVVSIELETAIKKAKTTLPTYKDRLTWKWGL